MNETKILTTLTELVSITSITSDEARALEYIKNRIDHENLEVHIGKTWLAARLGSKSVTNALIVNGHIDTVPAGAIDSWQQDPLVLTKNKGRLHGLGVSDMKSGIAVMIELLLSRPTVKRDVWFVFVAGEETDGIGSMDFAKWFVDSTSYSRVTALVAEPTDCAFIGIGHRGNLAYKITLTSDGGHGSKAGPIHGQLIPRALELTQSLTALNADWQDKYSDEFLGSPSITVSAIKTDENDSPNQMPVTCELAIDIRTTPKLEYVADEDLRTIAKAHGAMSVESITTPFAPVVTSKNSQIINVLQNLEPTLKVKAFTGATDLSTLKRIASDNIIFGPGDSTTMHTANESMPEENLFRYYEIMRQLLERF